MKNAPKTVDMIKAIKNAILHISSENHKLGPIASFAMTPFTTCPNCSHCCEVCYAANQYNQYPEVRKAYDDNANLAMFHLEEFEKQMNEWLDKNKPTWFRIHVSGDFFNVKYAEAWYRIAAKHSDTKFLVFTKAFDIVREVPFYLLDNFSLVLSAWLIPGVDPIFLEPPTDLKEHYPVSRAVLLNTDTSETSMMCPGNCTTCHACWNLKYNMIPGGRAETRFVVHGTRGKGYTKKMLSLRNEE